MTHHMVNVSTQLEVKQKLEGDHTIKDVMWTTLQQLVNRYGNRIIGLKSVIGDDGSIDYLDLSPYVIQQDEEGTVSMMMFKTNHANDSIKQAGFGSDYGIRNIWLDMSAEFFKPHVGATKLANFFGKKQGPKALESPGKSIFTEISKSAVVELQRKTKQQIANLKPTSDSSSGSSSNELKSQVKRIQDNEKELMTPARSPWTIAHPSPPTPTPNK